MPRRPARHTALRALLAALATATAACGGGGGSGTPSAPPPPTLASVEVLPANPSVAKGLSQAFTATGHYSDGSTQDLTATAVWSTADGAIASPSGALVRGVGQGATQVRAFAGGLLGFTTLTVTAPAVTAVTVSPTSRTLAAGTSLQYAAAAVLSDGTRQDVSASAAWASTPAGVATVTPAGLATGVAPGAATVSARYGGVTGSTPLSVTAATLASIVVTPATPSAALGVSVPFTATGLFSDGTDEDLTAQVAWTSLATTVATVSPAGVASPVAPGAATIRAALGGIAGATTITVTAATVTSIAVAPAAATLAAGTGTSLAATATFSDATVRDVTALATWSSSSGAVSVSGGAATAVSPGGATVTAAFGGKSGAASLTVTSAVLTSIAVSPPSPTVPAGAVQPFQATGTFSDGSHQDLTALASWVSSATGVAQVSNRSGEAGVATALGAGTATITASLGLVSGGAQLTVSAATLSSITVAPATKTVAAGDTVRFLATGHYSDLSFRDVSTLVTWTSSSGAAAVSNAVGTEGLAKGLATGSATISARLGGVTGSASLTVSGPALVSIAVAPASTSVPKGLAVAFGAVGTYGDGSTQDVTASATWSTFDTSVATAAGSVVTGVDVGVTQVIATVGTVQGTASLTVGPPVVVAVALTPANATIAAGTSLQYDAQALYSDGSRGDVTAAATWSAAPGAVATVAPGGVASGVAAGGATVTASFGGVAGSAPLAVTSAILTAVVVTPATPIVPLGIQQPFAATGLFSDHTAQDLTAQATWTSSLPAVATVSAAGVATPAGAGTTTIRAALGGVSGTTSLTVTTAALAFVTVTPASRTFAAGTTARYTAVATYSDATTQDVTALAAWTSSAPAVATVVDGVATGVAPGSATLHAALGATTSNAVAAEVTGAVLQQLGITPSGASVPAGVDQQLTATGLFSDGSSQDLTAAATWTSSVATVAAVSNAPGREGLVTAIAPGATSVSAAVGAVRASAPLTVSAAALASLDVQPATTTIHAGETVQFRATGTYTDTSTRDLTLDVVWSTSVAVATVSSAAGSEGLAKGVAPGTATITARLGAVAGGATLTVLPPVLLSIEVAPPVVSVPKGLRQTFTATGVFGDGSTQDLTGSATWSTLDPSVAVATGNVVECVAVGVTQVEASQGGVTGSAGLAVDAPIPLQLTVSPAGASLAAGTSLQYDAAAIYSDGTKVDVTASAAWAATPAGIATITPAGLATGLSASATPVTVTASALGLTGSVPLTVTSAVVQSVALAPTDPAVPLGVPVQFTATGIFTDGTQEDLTAQVAWNVSPSGVATISTTGLATPLSAGGPATVSATHPGSGISGTTTLTVSAATLTAIAIDQGSATVAAGTTFAFTATGTYSDLSTADVTAAATWTSSATTVATVASAGPSAGLATGLVPGLADITASLGGFSDFSPLTVTTAVIVSLSVSPSSATIPKGMTQALQALGTFSDGSTQDLTAAAGWTSSVTTCAAVSNAPGQEGVVTALGPGLSTVTAAYQGFSGTAAITVSSAAVASIDVSAATTTVPIGYTLQYHATAHYTDGSARDVTTQATWQSSSTAVATVSNAAGTQGIATGVSAGTATLSATLSGKTGSAPIRVVSATLQSIAVTPSPFSVTAAAGPSHTVQLRAMGTFNNGVGAIDITRQCAWSTNPKRNWATVQLGLVTGVRAGSGTVTAKKGNKSGQASGTVL